MKPLLLVFSAAQEPQFPGHSLVLAHRGVLPDAVYRCWRETIADVHVWSQSDIDLEDAHSSSRRHYELLLPMLSKILNELHHTSFPTIYWEIVLGPWLSAGITILTERFRNVIGLIQKYPEAKVGLLDQHDYICPETTHEFVIKSTTDDFNFQIYSLILRLIHPDVSTALAMRFAARQKSVSIPPVLWKAKVRRFLNWFSRLGLRNAIGLHQSSFTRADILHLMLASRLAIWPAVSLPFESSGETRNDQTRSNIATKLAYTEELEGKILCDLIAGLIPTCYIEGYPNLVRQSLHQFPNLPSAYLTANSLFYDELFKEWAARGVLNGSALLAIQHGGNYGLEKRLDGLAHEIQVARKFYSWGWSFTGSSKIIPMPAINLSKLEKSISKRESTGKIIYATTTRPRYPIDFLKLSQPETYQKYLTWQLRFLSACGEPIRADMSIRLHPSSYDWAVRERLIEHFNQLDFDMTKKFEGSLRKCSLIICDYLSTTVAQALAFNVPLLLFWDPEMLSLEDAAQSSIQELRDVGILHDTPESAAKKLRAISRRSREWWEEAERKTVVERYRFIYARSQSDALKSWHQELSK